MFGEQILQLVTVVFWGGIAYFVGIALIDAFSFEQEKIVRGIYVFERNQYYKQSLYVRVVYIFLNSTLFTKLKICVLLCIYCVSSAILAGATHTSTAAFQNICTQLFSL